MAISLRIPEKTKLRVAKLARAHDTTAHAFMVAAIEDRVQSEETRAAFHAEGVQRLARMRKTAEGMPAGEVFDYLRARISGKVATRPKPRKIS